MDVLVKKGLSLVGIGLIALFAMPAQAKEGDTFRPFVSYARYYDSNLFRLDQGESIIVQEGGVPVAITKQSASEQYGVLSAGLNLDWRPSRQRITANVSKSQVRYSRFSSNDNDGSDYSLKWEWRVGNHWSGQVGATESVTQSSFENVSINNQVTREGKFANADWQFHPRWSVGGGAATSTATNSTSQQTLVDYEDKSVFAALGYSTPKGSKLRGEFRQVKGEFPNRPSGSTVDPRYTQTEYNLLGDWSVSGKLLAHGKIGYLQRKNDSRSERDFSGVAGRLSADYSSTGKTALNWAIYREISNSDDTNASYQLNSGTSLGASWRATSKITLRANASYENRSFEGDPGVGGVQRDEDSLSGSLSLGYSPVRMATIDLGLQAGRRDSNISDNNYTFHSVFLNVRADF